MTTLEEVRRQYQGKHVLVTGGLGFIGSSLALELWRSGAHVTVADSSVAGCGANPFNLRPGEQEIALVQGDIGNTGLMAASLRQADVIFNLAGEVSHIHSMLYPERDLRINTTAHIQFIQACARYAPHKRVVFAGTRQVYGAPLRLPVAEDHPVHPVDYNGVHKQAAAQYHLLLTRMGQIDAMVLRLTNVYGPRMAIGLSCQGFLPVFFRRAAEGSAITVFGDGTQLRDPIYITDACAALLHAGVAVQPEQKTLNIGSSTALSLFEIAREISWQARLPEPVARPFPEGRKSIDIGSYVSSETLSLATLGWRSRTTLADGVRLTLEYYRRYSAKYLNAGMSCPLKHQAAAVAVAS